MISEDRHVDVLEMDAASHTGVGDIRDLIDTVRYLPTSARYKIYIIDEVHMLSTSAFNALLKTLEEPPPHVKFIFATTESRKIPVTILSRCQRFDLKRIDSVRLAQHLENIAAKENVQAEEEALKLIAIAAEGSVRDALSLLDQAIARGTEEGSGLSVTTKAVRLMIGAADHLATFRLLEILLRGDVAGAIAELEAQYAAGSDPFMLVQDALEIVHLVTRVKVAPLALLDISLSESDRAEAKKLADALSMPVLTRLWQMLLKGVSEVKLAPTPLSALEMLLVRIAYSAQLPTPVEVIRNMGSAAGETVLTQPANTEKKTPVPALRQVISSFEQAVALFAENREMLLHTQLRNDVWLSSFEEGKIELKLAPDLARDFTAKIADHLTRWTGQPWKILVSGTAANPSLHEQEIARKEKDIKEVSAHPLVASALQQFPGATVVGVKANA
jgi:DNA polymerase-3 subunit gamma/tau